MIQRPDKLPSVILPGTNPLSSFPVYQGNMDNVVGVLSVKDVLMALAKDTVDKQSPINSQGRTCSV